MMQIDVMRLLICASVVATHVVSNANPLESVASNAVVDVLHYTRQAFFFISAMVLVYVHGEETDRAGGLRRRIGVLGVPYLVWSTVYAVIGLITAYSWHDLVHFPWHWFVGTVQGTNGYHMYFLLVSVEFAMVFPLFVRLLKATRRHHLALLVGSCLLEIGLMACFHYLYLPAGWWHAVAGESSLLAYQFWFVAGGVAAMHVAQFHAWLRGHRLLVGFGLLTAIAATWGVYFAAVADGTPPEYAGRSNQPITVPLAIVAIAALYLVSVWLVGHGRAGHATAPAAVRPGVRTIVEVGTYLSFGIYLCHPAILVGLLRLQQLLPPGVARHAVVVTVVIAVLDFALAVLVASVLSRTRWAKALIGRPRRRKAPPRPVAEPATSG